MRRMFDVRELTLPIIAAPMAGGPSNRALATAVTDAGGLGFLAAGYKSAHEVADDLTTVRADSTGPIAVNLFVADPYDPDPAALEAYRRSLVPEATRLGVDPGEPRWDDDDWQGKLDVALDVRPDLVSFTFGCPSAETLRRLADREVASSVTVTSVDEARAAAARGAASVCVQGPEAGGHRGTWDVTADPGTTPLLELVAAVVAAVEVPVVAAGGISNVDEVRTQLDTGAAAVQVGTAYLLADEAGTNPTHRAALADPTLTRTAVTRAFTGRWARGLANRFVADHADAPAGYPHLHHLTSPLRRAAIAAGDVQVAHLWAGTGHTDAQPGRAADITRSLAP